MRAKPLLYTIIFTFTIFTSAPAEAHLDFLDVTFYQYRDCLIDSKIKDPEKYNRVTKRILYRGGMSKQHFRDACYGTLYSSIMDNGKNGGDWRSFSIEGSCYDYSRRANRNPYYTCWRLADILFGN